MTTAADLLTAYETCRRQAYWRARWHRGKLSPVEVLQAAIRAGVTSTRKDFGECAGEECYGLGVAPGLWTENFDVHGEVIHLACLADVIATAVRSPAGRPWITPQSTLLDNGMQWTPSAMLDPEGNYLRRVVLVSSWNDNRHYSQSLSWYSLGEVAAYALPMQQVVIVLGSVRDGKRYSAWAKGLLHPLNKKLRFRKRNAVREPFKESWLSVWREDHDEISTQQWLQAMLDDGILKDLCFTVKIDVPDKPARQRILDIAARRLEKLDQMKTLPDEQYTNCSWPTPCLFCHPCHRGESPSGRSGFVRKEESNSH